MEGEPAGPGGGLGFYLVFGVAWMGWSWFEIGGLRD